MRRGLCLVAFAVAAISLGSAAHPQRKGNAEQNQTGSELQASTARIVDAINHIGGKNDSGCEDRKDKRSSDLCAQWKAADAARDAADYTLLAVFLSFVGTFLVALTFWEQRKTSRAELRAYVLLDMAEVHKCSEEGAPDFKGCSHPEARYVVMGIKNFGATPAHNVVFRVGTGIHPFPSVQPFPKMPDDLMFSNGDLAPRAPRTMTLEVFNSGPAHEALRQGRLGIFAWGLVEYEDIFGRPHRTRIQLVCEGQGYLIGRFHETGENNESN